MLETNQVSEGCKLIEGNCWTSGEQEQLVKAETVNVG